MDVLVRFRPSDRSVRVPVGTTLLEAAHRAELPVARACGARGLCGRCGMRVLAGAAGLEPEGAIETRAKQRNRVDPAERLSCQVTPTGDVLVTARYW